jgi:hypothetical protein
MKQKKQTKGPVKPKETKAHEKAVEFIKMKATTTTEDKPQFKLKRFQNVEARIGTNRLSSVQPK